MTYLLGIDISTTGSKALLIDEHGTVIASHTTPHPSSQPYPLWSEQNPADWWSGIVTSIRAVLEQIGDASAVKAIGLTGQMHGLVCLDAKNAILRPAILWNDQRTQAQCDLIHKRIGREKFIQISGNVALTGFTAPKILWVAENEPDVYARVRHILLPKDYVRFCLTGEYGMDKADGSGTVLFDLKQRNWSSEILDALQIKSEWLPPTYEGSDFTGVISKSAAASTGLAAGTPVAAGGGDQAAQAVGVGAVEPGIVGLTVGTSGVVFATTPSALIEPEGRLHAFCHAVPGAWHFMGVMLSAAGSLQWYRDTLAVGSSFDELTNEAQEIPAGSEGLQFLPYLSGERTPHPDPQARAGFIGLTIRHNRAHMTRAVMEGVSFGLKDIFTLIRDSGLKDVQQVRASGGGTKSPLWRQILASVLDSELVTVNTTEGAAFGAALLAGVGTGTWPDVHTACRETIQITGRTTPLARDVPVYQRSYNVYQELYPALKHLYPKMI
ncbi:MAG: xylulokinase [Anaerolineaceae bacterium]|nr:xylulokinase [Anaerolineaceae bacterium]